MIDTIVQLDQKLFLLLNHINSESLDPIMLFLSKSYIPGVLILLFLIGYGYKQYNKGVILVIFFTFLTIGFSDGISSRFFKPTFKRLRPCHEPILKPQVYTAGKKCWGGKFGFVSSHAANTFGVATFIFLLFLTYTKKTFVLFIWAALVSYSRIYLAKHYPLDLFFGGLLGMLCGYLCFRLFKLSYQKIKWFSQDQ